MHKDFDGWTNKKTALNSKSEIKRFNEREVWWCSVGHNIGFEQDGKGKSYSRPVLVIRKFNKQSFFGIPLSTKGKINHPYYHQFILKDKKSYALLSQLRIFDAKRLINIEGTVSKPTYNKILERFIKIFSKK